MLFLSRILEIILLAQAPCKTQEIFHRNQHHQGEDTQEILIRDSPQYAVQAISHP